MAVAWYLTAGRRWAAEAVKDVAHFFHCAAWVLPSLLAMLAFGISGSDGDVLTGVCSFGLWDTRMMGYFLLLPLGVCLVVGVVVFIVDFVYLYEVRSSWRKSPSAVAAGGHDPEVTMKMSKEAHDVAAYAFRIRIFALFYVVPMAVFVAALSYEYLNLDAWLVTWQDRHCKDLGMRCPSDHSAQVLALAEPMLWVYLLKYMSRLFIPLASLYWIASRDTLTSWRRFFARLCGYPYREAAREDPDHQPADHF